MKCSRSMVSCTCRSNEINHWGYLARVLPPPTIGYRGQINENVVEHVTVGKWTIRNRFYQSPPIDRWGMIYFGPKPDPGIISLLREFETKLPSVNLDICISCFILFLLLVLCSIWNCLPHETGPHC